MTEKTWKFFFLRAEGGGREGDGVDGGSSEAVLKWRIAFI